ncbi:MAG: GNAT family N-acetyltransferase [Treponema sp.]|nr:GNAT family N-acetyltransferase [Treponema sp.]
MEDFEIINYFDDDYQEYWRNEINRGDWDGCQKLFEILNQNKFKEIYGENSKLYLVTDGESLICFCGFMEKNPVDENKNPWIGFVYTFSEYRGNGYMKELIDYIYDEENCSELFVATEHNGLYEKFGFSFVEEKLVDSKNMRIYKK